MEIKFFESPLSLEIVDKLILLSDEWAKENSCYGYRANTIEDIEPNRIFLATQKEEIIGYLFGKLCKAEKMNSILTDGEDYFEIEELYVIPTLRSKGIGKKLFDTLEDTLKNEDVQHIMLSTATKDYQKIFNFYINELSMSFWSARLFKKLQ